MTLNGSHVDRLLGAPELRPFVDWLVRRIELGHPLQGRMVRAVANADERAAIAAIIGRSLGTGASISVDFDRLEEIVRTSGAAPSLTAAVEHLRGSIVVRAEHAQQQRRAWDAAHDVLDAFVADWPEHAAWALSMRTRGSARRLVSTPEAVHLLLERVVAVLAELPSNGEALPRLAARLLGSAHALDLGMPAATLVLSALNRGDGRAVEHRACAPTPASGASW